MPRHVIELPTYQDRTSRKKLIRTASKALDISSGAFAVEAVLPADGGVQVVLTTDAPDPRVGVSKQPLAHSVGKSDGPKVAAMAARTGQALVAFRPFDHEAVLQHAPALDVAVRDAVASALKRDPWEVRVWVECNGDGDVARVHVARAPAGVTREALGEALLAGVAELDLDIVPHAEWVIPRRNAGRKTFFAHARVDPLREIIAYPEDAVSTYRAIPFGVDEDGEEVSIRLIERTLLLGGIPGGGKSGGITALLKGISRLEHVAIVGIDPKLVEQVEWEPRFSTIVNSPADTLRVLNLIIEEMLRRYERLKHMRGVKKISEEILSADFPIIAVVVDELADLVSGGATKEEKEVETGISSALRRLVSLGRAAGISLITATQKPASEVVPTSLRDVISQRVGYATTNPAMTDTILGAGASQAGGLCHEIPPALVGGCYVRGESDRTSRRARTYWVPDDDIERLAEETAHLRVPLPWLTGEDAVPVHTPEELDTMLDDLELSLDDLDDDPITLALRALNGDDPDGEPLVPL